MRLRAIHAMSALGALVLTSPPHPALADADLSSSSFRPNAYTFAAGCDLAQPLLFINVLLRNTGDAPSEPIVLKALDVTKVFSGDLTVPPILPRADTPVQVPMRATDAALQPGTHVITVFVGSRSLKPLVIQIPATLCPAPGPSSARKKPAINANAAAEVAQEANAVSPYARPAQPTLKTRAPAPQRITTPQMFYLGNYPYVCTLGIDRCVQAMGRRSLQVSFGWGPCKLPTCAQTFTRFEIYRVPRGGSQPRLKPSDTEIVAETISHAPLSDDDIDAPVPKANATLPPGFIQVASGGSSVSTVFLSSFTTGDCYAVRVQSAQGYYSQLSSGMCVDRATPIGIAERDVPADQAIALDYGPRGCRGDSEESAGSTNADAPFVGFDPERKCWHDAVIHFRVPFLGSQPVWLVTGWLVADGNARCAYSLGLLDNPYPPKFHAFRRTARSGNVLKDDVTNWVTASGDLTIRIFGGGKDCYERLSNFRIHLIAPARNTAREPIPDFTLPSWFQPVKQ